MNNFALKLKTSMAVEKRKKQEHVCGFLFGVNYNSKLALANVHTKKVSISRRRSRKIYAQFLCA